MNRHPNIFKIVLIGDVAVGKSSLLSVYADDQFPPLYNYTVALDYRIRTQHLRDGPVLMKLWDTAGQERYRSIARFYYRGADGFVVVFNLSDRLSFNNVHQWFRDIQLTVDEEVSIVLVGNQCDLEEARTIPKEEAETLARKYGIKYIETSAKDRINVSTMFQMMAMEIKKRRSEEGKRRKKERLEMLKKEDGTGSLVEMSDYEKDQHSAFRGNKCCS